MFLFSAFQLSPRAFAHCDTMDCPVILAAKAALEHNDITPVLKWVKPDGEAEVKAAFNKAIAVRAKGADAREIADQFFFETLVRVHRAGEGAPYTGLKPAGTPPDPAIHAADKALEGGSLDEVVTLVTNESAAGIRRRFADTKEKQRHAGQDVDAGRAFVAAYVEYVHYVEGLNQAAQGRSTHQETGSGQLSSQEVHTQRADQHNH